MTSIILLGGPYSRNYFAKIFPMQIIFRSIYYFYNKRKFKTPIEIEFFTQNALPICQTKALIQLSVTVEDLE